MNQEREAYARIIDPTAWEEYLLEDGRVDVEVAAIFRDAYEESLTKADQILALRSGGGGWRPITAELIAEAFVETTPADELPGTVAFAQAPDVVKEHFARAAAWLNDRLASSPSTQGEG